MYRLPYFTEPDPEKVFQFMQQNEFALICGNGEYPVATQIPLLILRDDNGMIRLQGHLMKGTDHHKAFEKNNKVLVVFTGPHCYVSASWYTKPKSASTWNYISVHAKGIISFMDEAGTYKMLKQVTDKYETASEEPSLMEDMPEGYVPKLIKAIVGFSIEVEEIENVFKLSQNHDLQTQQNVVRKLKERGDFQSVSIANEMESRLNVQTLNISH